jgi:hypothetical protein
MYTNIRSIYFKIDRVTIEDYVFESDVSSDVCNWNNFVSLCKACFHFIT